MILTEAGLEFRKRGIFLTVNEKLLKCSLFHYLGNEWKITDWTEILVDQIVDFSMMHVMPMELISIVTFRLIAAPLKTEIYSLR